MADIFIFGIWKLMKNDNEKKVAVCAKLWFNTIFDVGFRLS